MVYGENASVYVIKFHSIKKKMLACHTRLKGGKLKAFTCRPMQFDID